MWRANTGTKSNLLNLTFMKTPAYITITKTLRTILVVLLALIPAVHAMADWQLNGPVTPPGIGGTYWSLALGTSYPPLPCVPLLFAEGSVYEIVGSPGNYAYDDTGNPDHTQSERMTTESEGGGSGGDDPQPMIDYSTNLWISLDTHTNESDGTTYFFTIHNCQTGSVYELISCTNVVAPMDTNHWISEFVGLANSTNLSAYVPMGGKKDYNFFRAHLWTDFNYGVPTNGQIFIQSLTNNIYPVVNGVTNHLMPFCSNWFVLNPRPTNLYTINLGYDASDGGMTNSIINTNPPQQVIRFAGFSKTITNICISSNYITGFSVAGWPALQSVDAWHCISNLNVDVKNCPELRRTCFEAIQGVSTYGITNVLDYSGCPHIAEIRAADNRFPNVIVTNGAGPEVWHLCIHDNNQVTQLPADFNFSVYPSLRELWVWDNQFSKPLALSNANSTNLASVEIFNNRFPSADFTGQTNIDHILIDGNAPLTNLIVSGCTKLKQLDASGDGLSTASVDLILSDLDAMGIFDDGANNPFVKLGSGTNATPSLDGMRRVSNLLNKGWDVTIHLPPAGTPNISAVAVPNISSNTATITWTTDIASDSTVYYGTSYSGNSASYVSFTDPASVTSHSVTLTGLTAATNYYFFVRSTSGAYTGTSGDYQFTTRGGPGIYFVNTSSTIKMEVTVTGSPTITWLWGDGSATVGGSQATHTFSSNTTSYVVINPPTSLLAFGVQCQTTYDTLLSSVNGLTNYPNLRGLYLYLTALGDVSLAGCTNLTYAAMAGCTNASTNTIDAWFNDLALAQTNIAHITGNFSKCGDPTASFFCPAKTSYASTNSQSVLTNKGWTLYLLP